MNIHRDLDTLPEFQNSVITVGTFDGIHKGHQEIIKKLTALAKEIDGESLVVTFHPHPRSIIYPEDDSLKLINTLEETTNILGQYPIDHFIIAPFTKQFSEISAEEYVKTFLVEKFHPKKVAIGYDHHFGNGRNGGIQLLEDLAPSFGYEVEEIPKKVVDDISVSSTKIREAISTGKVEIANSMLGYLFTMKGLVVKGNQIGHSLGFPTANIEIEDSSKIIPSDGVYAIKVMCDGQEYNGMLNIGYRPTFDGSKKTNEVHIFDFTKGIYNKEIRIELVKQIRKEQKFKDTEALRQQLICDKEMVLGILS